MGTHAVVELRLVGEGKLVDSVLKRIEEVLDVDAGLRQDSRKNRGKVVQYGVVIVELPVE